VLLSEFLGRLFIHNTLVCQITLVANQKLIHPFTCIPLNLLEPLLDVGVRLPIGHVVHDDDAVCATVVAACDGSESLLSSSIPDLQLDGLAIERDSLDFLSTRSDWMDSRQSVEIALTKSTPIVLM